MDNNQVTELLKNFRSYEYAAGVVVLHDNTNIRFDTDIRPLVYAERKRNMNLWDKQRYTRIVNVIRGAVEYVLNDDQRTIIQKKYMDRNTINLSEIATLLHKDRSTIREWHKDAINRLSIAMQPLTEDEREIHNFDHMFDREWKYQEPA